MATRRRDLTPRKDKTGGSQSPSHNHKPNSPQNHDPTAPNNRSTSSPRPAAVRSSANVVHKHLVKTQSSLDSARKPTGTAKRTVEKTPFPSQRTRAPTKPPLGSRTTSPLPTQKRQFSTAPSLRNRDRTPLPTEKKHVSNHPSLRDKTPLQQKTRVLTPFGKTRLPAEKAKVQTNSSLRIRDQTPLRARKPQVSPSPFPRKIMAPEKTFSGTNLKALYKDDVPTNTALRTKEKIICTFQENVENLNVHENLLEDEILVEVEEVKTLESVEPLDITGLALEENEENSLHIGRSEAENRKDDDKCTEVVTIESCSAFEREVFLAVKKREPEETSVIKEKSEEHSGQEIIDINRSVADDYHKDKVEEVEKEEKEKVSHEKKDELTGESEVHEPVEVKEAEVVEKQKHESENKGQTQGSSRWRNGSVISNKEIEETASKLRDQRVSRVRALAGAFESVMQ